MTLEQEVKQIAGRAGRFGTAYAEGRVTTLHGTDTDRLRHCLLQPDTTISGAGIFPSRQQLELLGALLDSGVGSVRTLQDFWEDHFDQCASFVSAAGGSVEGDWDSDCDSERKSEGEDEIWLAGEWRGGAGVVEGGVGVSNLRIEFSIEDVYRPEFIRQHFPSLQVFSQHLTRFVQGRSQFSSSERQGGHSRRGNGESRSGGRKTSMPSHMDPSRFPQTPLSTLLGVFKNSVTFPATLRTAAGKNEDRGQHQGKKKSKKKAKVKARQSRQQGLPLSEEGHRSLYFVGDLEERRQVAEALERVSVRRAGADGAVTLSMSFRDQYVFSLAPVNVDNPEVMRALAAIVERYLLATAPLPLPSAGGGGQGGGRSAVGVGEEEETDDGLKVWLPKKYLKLKR
jgi:hypothetical protein